MKIIFLTFAESDDGFVGYDSRTVSGYLKSIKRENSFIK